MSDIQGIETLLARIALRDPKAFRVLYELCAGQLLAVALRVLQHRAEAEEVVQEVFVKLWNQSVPGTPGQSRTLAWLCVITRNRAVDFLRQRRPETPLVWQDAEGNEQHHDVSCEDGSPMDQLLAHEQDERLGTCMGGLAAEPRLALMLAFYEGLTHPQIAERMRKPLGTIKAWTRRSLLRLKGCLEAAA